MAKATVCKTVITGSNPVAASNFSPSVLPRFQRMSYGEPESNSDFSKDLERLTEPPKYDRGEKTVR